MSIARSQYHDRFLDNFWPMKQKIHLLSSTQIALQTHPPTLLKQSKPRILKTVRTSLYTHSAQNITTQITLTTPLLKKK